MGLLSARDLAMMQADALRVITSYAQQVIWLQKVTPTTPGAVQASDYDSLRQQVLSMTGQSFGAGWVVTIGASTYSYLPQPIVAAIAEEATQQQFLPEGFTTYEGPLAITQAALAKGDVLVLGTRRFVVGDTLDLLQAFATLLWHVVTLEARAAGNSVYTLPTS